MTSPAGTVIQPDFLDLERSLDEGRAESMMGARKDDEESMMGARKNDGERATNPKCSFYFQ